MSQLKVSRFVELDDLAVHRNVQSNSRDRDLNVIRVRSLVSVPDRFHVLAARCHSRYCKLGNHRYQSVVLSLGQIGLEFPADYAAWQSFFAEIFLAKG
jgi:hypothetical protein